MSSLIERVRINIEDVRMFGPSILLRHLGRLKGDRITAVKAGHTRIHVRAGDSDMAAVRQVFGNHEYELRGFGKAWTRLHARYEEILAESKRPVIIDAGANIGTASVWFKEQFPEAAIVAVEPDAGNVQVLRMNTAGLDKVTVLEAAIGSEPGHVALISEGLSWAIQTERAKVGVPIVTIDEAVAQAPDGVLFLAKIDIEGFERDLFASNLEWLGKTAAVIVELHDWMLPGEYTSVPFQRAIASHSFEMFNSGENMIYIR